MLTKLRFFATIFSFILIATPFLFSQEPKRKLAVLKIVYEDFTPEERQTANQAFYENLSRFENILVLPEINALAALRQAGSDPDKLDAIGYVNAGKILHADYVLVGKMEKVGDFVEVAFKLFTVSQQFQKEYSGGKTMKIFVEQEIPKIVQEIRQDLASPLPARSDSIRVALPKPPAPSEIRKTAKRSKWPWLALGGVAVAGSAVAILSADGDKTQPPPKGLPRPPVVP